MSENLRSVQNTAVFVKRTIKVIKKISFWRKIGIFRECIFKRCLTEIIYCFSWYWDAWSSSWV
jgi:hypothetical protein